MMPEINVDDLTEQVKQIFYDGLNIGVSRDKVKTDNRRKKSIPGLPTSGQQKDIT